MLARLYIAGGEPAEAERTLTEGGPLTGVSQAQSLAALAQVQRTLHKREPLAQTLAGILKLEPENANVARELALLLMGLNRPAKARPLLSTSLQSTPGDTEVLFQLARAEWLLKNSAVAETHLKRLMELDPGHVPGMRLKIQILRKGKKWKLLTERLEEFLARFPRDAEARYGLISAYLNLFNTEKARPHYEILKAERPAMVRALHSYFQ